MLAPGLESQGGHFQASQALPCLARGGAGAPLGLRGPEEQQRGGTWQWGCGQAEAERLTVSSVSCHCGRGPGPMWEVVVPSPGGEPGLGGKVGGVWDHRG